MRGRASGKRSIDSAAMGGEQKPVHHRLGRGGKKPIVIIGTVVGFFVVLSMTGLGHSHNHVERDMPAHAALSGRGARRHRPEADHFARARAGGGAPRRARSPRSVSRARQRDASRRFGGPPRTRARCVVRECHRRRHRDDSQDVDARSRGPDCRHAARLRATRSARRAARATTVEGRTTPLFPKHRSSPASSARRKRRAAWRNSRTRPATRRTSIVTPMGF